MTLTMEAAASFPVHGTVTGPDGRRAGATRFLRHRTILEVPDDSQAYLLVRWYPGSVAAMLAGTHPGGWATLQELWEHLGERAAWHDYDRQQAGDRELLALSGAGRLLKRAGAL